MAEYHQHVQTETGRIRKESTKQRYPRRDPLHAVNPYPWMSRPEALVKLELEHRQVPFSWRYFDGDAASAPNFMQMLGRNGFYPEFTLRDYKTCIFVAGAYFGSLPGVIDKTALAQTLLEADGWKVVVLYEFEIRFDLQATFDRELPELAHPTIKGPEHENTQFGTPQLTNQLRHTRVHLKIFKRHKKAVLAESGEHVNERVRKRSHRGRSVSDGRIRGRGLRGRTRPTESGDGT